ncbi:MAG: hypothetical protein ACK50P_09625 [Planctomycetaceae bacterium]
MAVTIHYRGTINSLSLAEDFEDRLLELALALGGTGRVWRSSPGGAPQRMFRGMILNLAPGQESTSLILSPEGWLVGLNDLEGAARPGLTIPPWCQVKTGLGPMEGHVALIEMFRVLKGEFLNDLEVRDETGYWESGDGLQLARSWGDATGHGGEGQPGFRGLSREAAEDPEIVGARLSRVAAVVRQTLGRPAQMLDPGGNSRAGQNSSRDLDDRSREQRWEQIERFRRRMQERLQRSIQERLSQGETIDQAIRGALESAGLPRPEELKLILPQELTDEDDPADSESGIAEHDDAFLIFPGDLNDVDDEDETDDNGSLEDLDDQSELEPEPDEPSVGSVQGRIIFSGLGGLPWKRPLPAIVDRATDLSADGQIAMSQLQRLGLAEGLENARDTLLQGLSDLCGGLVQAMINLPPEGDAEDDDREPWQISGEEQELHREARIMAVVQLRRALRGAAFAQGALAQFHDPPGLSEAPISRLADRLRQMSEELHAELDRLQTAESPTDE